MGINLKGMATTALLLFAVTSILGAAPRLQLSTAALGPVVVAAGGLNQQTVEAYNAGDGSLSLTIQSSASWLAGSIGAARPCTTRTGNCLPLTLSLSPGTLPSGTYTEFVQVNDPNAVDAPQQITVTMTVGGVPASISLYAAPATGANGNSTSVQVYPSSPVTGTVATQSGGNWLQFSLGGNGSFFFGLPYNVQATPLSSMAPGTYNGSVTLSGSSNSTENRAIPVTFNITSAPIIQTPVASLRLLAAAGTKTNGIITFNNNGQGSLAVTAASVAANGPTPSSIFTASGSGTSVTVTADASGLSPGLYSGTVTITSNAANNSQIAVPVSLTVTGANTPQIYSGGVTNIVSYLPGNLGQGEIATIAGTQLAPAGSALQPSSTPLPTNLGGVQVLVNNVPAPLFYVSPTQINFQVPYEVPAGTTATVQVMNGSTAGNLRSINVTAAQPRIMPWPSYVVPGNYGIIVNYSDGSLVLPVANQIPGFKSHPAKPGDLLVMYCLGMGQTSPSTQTGTVNAGGPVNGTLVTFGGGFSGPQVTIPPLFAGLSGGVGLYQVNIAVPKEVLPGNVPVQLTMNGVGSNFVYVPVSLNGQ